MKKSRSIWIALVFAIPILIGYAQRPSNPPAGQEAVTDRVVSAANAFLGTLSPAERAKLTFAFDSSQRTGWSNLPSGIFQRNGLRLGDLTQQQRSNALALVAAALSRDGYQKVTNI